MPHILINQKSFNGDQRFQTHSAILDHTPYSPKVLIVGTYNEANIQGNAADFFYGRNYFWPVFANLRSNRNSILQKRILRLRSEKIPSLTEVIQLCAHFKLSFADLVTDVDGELENHDDIHVEEKLRNNNATSNHQNIINYINRTPSITHVYATTKFSGCGTLKNRWGLITNGSRGGLNFGMILTPSGRGRTNNFGGVSKVIKIARYWVWANHPESPYGQFTAADGYTYMDHVWLTGCGVNVNLF